MADFVGTISKEDAEKSTNFVIAMFATWVK
jgi:hypothetical protein